MVRDPNAVKQPYIAPSFEVVNAADARKQLEAGKDEDSQKMLSVLTQMPKHKKVS